MGWQWDILGVRRIDHVARTVEFVPPQGLDIRSVSMDLPVEGGGVIRAGWTKGRDGLRETLVLPDGWRRISHGNRKE